MENPGLSGINGIMSFVTAAILWLLGVLCLHLFREYLITWTYYYVSFDASVPIMILLPAAPAGFAVGVMFTSRMNDRELVLGWSVLGVMLFMLLSGIIYPFGDMVLLSPIFVLAAPALGIISTIRGTRLKVERKLQHFAWLILVIAVILGAYVLMEPISSALDPQWP